MPALKTTIMSEKDTFSVFVTLTGKNGLYFLSNRRTAAMLLRLPISSGEKRSGIFHRDYILGSLLHRV